MDWRWSAAHCRCASYTHFLGFFRILVSILVLVVSVFILPPRAVEMLLLFYFVSVERGIALVAAVLSRASFLLSLILVAGLVWPSDSSSYLSLPPTCCIESASVACGVLTRARSPEYLDILQGVAGKINKRKTEKTEKIRFIISLLRLWNCRERSRQPKFGLGGARLNLDILQGQKK